jgi:hypothetical protein
VARLRKENATNWLNEIKKESTSKMVSQYSSLIPQKWIIHNDRKIWLLDKRPRCQMTKGPLRQVFFSKGQMAKASFDQDGIWPTSPCTSRHLTKTRLGPSRPKVSLLSWHALCKKEGQTVDEDPECNVCNVPWNPST